MNINNCAFLERDDFLTKTKSAKLPAGWHMAFIPYGSVALSLGWAIQ